MEILVLVVALLALSFLLLPLYLWAILGDEASPKFEVFNPAQHAAPHEVTAFILENIAPLKGEGFQQVGDLVRQRGMVTTRVAILQHPDGVTGTVVVASSTQGNATPMVEFTAELSGGRVFDVNNMTATPIFSSRPGHEVYRFPEVRDPRRLHQIFRLLLRRRFGAAALRQREIAGNPARFLAEISDDEHRRQVETGYYRFDQKTNRFRPTLRGAYLMSWKSMPPFGQLRRAAVRRKARALLREIGMEGPDQRPVAAPESVTQTEEPEFPKSDSRGTNWSGILLWVGIIGVFAAMFLVERFVGNGLAAIAIFFAGMLGLLWLTLRRQGAGRVIVPIAALAGLVVAGAGFREYQARQPITRRASVSPPTFRAQCVSLPVSLDRERDPWWCGIGPGSSTRPPGSMCRCASLGPVSSWTRRSGGSSASKDSICSGGTAGSGREAAPTAWVCIPLETSTRCCGRCRPAGKGRKRDPIGSSRGCGTSSVTTRSG